MRTYTCFHCKCECTTDVPVEEVEEEFARDFPGTPLSEKISLCDDCWEMVGGNQIRTAELN